MRARPLLVPFAVWLAVLSVVPAARAQTGGDVAARRELIAQAQVARTAGDHARALDLAMRASQLRMTSSVRRFLAEEYLALGQLAEALGAADQCVVEAGAEPPSRNRDAVSAGCRTLLESLRGRVGRVVVRVPAPAPAGLVVRVGGHPLHQALWGMGYVVTPGPVVIEASAAGRVPFHREVAIAAGQSQDVEVALAPEPPPAPVPAVSPPAPAPPETPPVPTSAAVQATPPAATPATSPQPAPPAATPATSPQPTPAAPPAPVAVQSTTPAVAPPPAGPAPVRTRRVRSTAGPALMAIGAVAAVMGGVLYYLADLDYQNLGPSAAGVQCTSERIEPCHRIELFDTIANVGMFGGGGLFALGVVLLFALTHTEPVPHAPQVMLDPLHRTAGLAVRW